MIFKNITFNKVKMHWLFHKRIRTDGNSDGHLWKDQWAACPVKKQNKNQTKPWGKTEIPHHSKTLLGFTTSTEKNQDGTQ